MPVLEHALWENAKSTKDCKRVRISNCAIYYVLLLTITEFLKLK